MATAMSVLFVVRSIIRSEALAQVKYARNDAYTGREASSSDSRFNLFEGFCFLSLSPPSKTIANLTFNLSPN